MARRAVLAFAVTGSGSLFVGRVCLIVNNRHGPAIFVGAATAKGVADAAMIALCARYGDSSYILELIEL